MFLYNLMMCNCFSANSEVEKIDLAVAVEGV